MNSGSMSSIFGKSSNKATVKIDDFWDVAGDDKAFKNNSKDERFSPQDNDKIVDKARSMVGDKDYNVMSQNCEHFASFCRYGKSISDQVDNAIEKLNVSVLVSATVSGTASGDSKLSKE